MQAEENQATVLIEALDSLNTSNCHSATAECRDTSTQILVTSIISIIQTLSASHASHIIDMFALTSVSTFIEKVLNKRDLFLQLPPCIGPGADEEALFNKLCTHLDKLIDSLSKPFDTNHEVSEWARRLEVTLDSPEISAVGGSVSPYLAAKLKLKKDVIDHGLPHIRAVVRCKLFFRALRTLSISIGGLAEVHKHFDMLVPVMEHLSKRTDWLGKSQGYPDLSPCWHGYSSMFASSSEGLREAVHFANLLRIDTDSAVPHLLGTIAADAASQSSALAPSAASSQVEGFTRGTLSIIPSQVDLTFAYNVSAQPCVDVRLAREAFMMAHQIIHVPFSINRGSAQSQIALMESNLSLLLKATFLFEDKDNIHSISMPAYGGCGWLAFCVFVFSIVASQGVASSKGVLSVRMHNSIPCTADFAKFFPYSKEECVELLMSAVDDIAFHWTGWDHREDWRAKAKSVAEHWAAKSSSSFSSLAEWSSLPPGLYADPSHLAFIIHNNFGVPVPVVKLGFHATPAAYTSFHEALLERDKCHPMCCALHPSYWSLFGDCAFFQLGFCLLTASSDGGVGSHIVLFGRLDAPEPSSSGLPFEANFANVGQVKAAFDDLMLRKAPPAHVAGPSSQAPPVSLPPAGSGATVDLADVTDTVAGAPSAGQNNTGDADGQSTKSSKAGRTKRHKTRGASSNSGPEVNQDS